MLPLLRLAGAMLWLACAGAQAGGFAVLPTQLRLGAERGVQSVVLTNTSPTTMTVESQVVVWPEDAAEQLASDIVVTPPVLTLPPGQRMRVRIGLLRAGKGTAERAYRLYFTELPAPAPLQGVGVGVRLRIGIPVFVAPQQPRPQPLQWLAQRTDEGWEVIARNDGNVHARVAEPVLLEGNAPFNLGITNPYVLAGGTTRFTLPAGANLNPATDLRVRWMDGDDARDSAVARH